MKVQLMKWQRSFLPPQRFIAPRPWAVSDDFNEQSLQIVHSLPHIYSLCQCIQCAVSKLLKVHARTETPHYSLVNKPVAVVIMREKLRRYDGDREVKSMCCWYCWRSAQVYWFPHAVWFTLPCPKLPDQHQHAHIEYPWWQREENGWQLHQNFYPSKCLFDESKGWLVRREADIEEFLVWHIGIIFILWRLMGPDRSALWASCSLHPL